MKVKLLTITLAALTMVSFQKISAQKLPTIETQLVGLESVANARELGGYRMSDGRVIKHGLLLRGGALHALTPNDVERMERDIRPVYDFDFRTQGEVEHAPDMAVKGCKYVWLPTIDPQTDKLGTLSLPEHAYRNLPVYLSEHASDPKVKYVASRMYLDMVANEYTQLQYAAFLQMLVEAPEGPIYWHCSQGKDRTGLGSAFILVALGADKDLIIRDFDMSNEYYRKDVAELSAKIMEKGWGEEEIKVVRTFIGANTEYFVEALDFIEKEYGSLMNYVTNVLLLSEDDMRILRDKFLE